MAVEVFDGGFGLYIHWPFCQAKCPYCDFNSHVVARVDQGRWVEAFRMEIARAGAETGDRILDSVFFGGGTPSLMEGRTVAAILDAVRATWRTANALEVTLEANPTSVEAGRFASYRDAGVTRVSLGIQALDDEDLRRLGRLHSADDARVAFALARSIFDKVSFDLIYARQNQSLLKWQEELSRALEMAGNHISLYQLTVEPGTAFADRMARGRLSGLPGEDLAADLYDKTLEMCADAGFVSYEVSNLARAGEFCRHNLIYWSAGDWVGLGPGAHGRLSLGSQRIATEAAHQPGRWLEDVEAGDRQGEARTVLSPEDQASEYLMMGLRATQGISIPRLRGLIGDSLTGKLDRLTEDGLLCQRGDRLHASDYGRLVLNAVLRELLA